ncbi:MAG: diguanylate cyclase [Nocardioides sp.]|uniref:GGDEF domain-containing protein n=1 Tax=Nocardioides sp. TaxID=35761 RepID=UPI0039E4D07B
MSTEPLSLMLASSAFVAVAASVFGVTTLQRHDDRANRLDAAALIATFLGLIAAPAVGRVGAFEASGSDRTAGAVVAVILTLGAGTGASLLWASAQAFAGRTPMVGTAGAGVLLGCAATVVLALSLPRWELMPTAVVVGLGFAFAAVELRRGAMSSNLNSLLLQGTLWASAVAIAVLAVLVGADKVGHEDGWAAIEGIVAATFVVAAMTLMALRVERYGNWWALGEEQDRTELGLHENGAFTAEAVDRLERCANSHQPVNLITAGLPGLHELNLAYGHPVGDAALRWVADVLRRQAPPSAVLGHLGGGRFAMVTSRDPELVANSILTGMMRVPPPATLPVRLTPVFAWASSDEAGYDLELLRQTADERLSHVH